MIPTPTLSWLVVFVAGSRFSTRSRLRTHSANGGVGEGTKRASASRAFLFRGNWRWIEARSVWSSGFFRAQLRCCTQRILRQTRWLHNCFFEPDLSPYSLGGNESLSRRIGRRRSPYRDLIRAAHEQRALPQGGLSSPGRAEKSAQWRAKRFVRAGSERKCPQRRLLYSQSPRWSQGAKRQFFQKSERTLVVVRHLCSRPKTLWW